MLTMILVLSVLLILAYRGKGGWFESWGIKSATQRHVLGAVIAALAVHGLGWHALAAAPLWFLFTKPDIGTGFAAIHGGEHFLQEINQQRHPLDFVCHAADEAAKWFIVKFGEDYYSAGVLWMTIRQLYVLPFLIFAGVTWALPGCLLLGGIYWLGGALNRRFGLDPVESAEVLTAVWLGVLMGV